MRLLVCGGRAFKDKAFMWSALNGIPEISCIVTGGQRLWNPEIRRWVGADWLAIEWALEKQIPFIGHPAPWNVNGRAGGPMRNGEMLRMWQPDKVLAFPGGDGTADMVKKAQAAGLPVDFA